MDDCRFDELSRALARGTSRRRVLAGLVGGVFGGFAALRGSETSVEAARRQAIGARCTRGAECASFLCVDGVCCDSPCTGQCESCASGACQPVSGAPTGNRPTCPGSGECAATCDGVTRNACVFPNSGTVCGESACVDGVQTTFSCAGNGTCHPTTTSCGLFACGVEGTCLTSCASDDDCMGEAFCASGICQGDLPAGQPCAGPDQCQSGLCVDGVCCNSACGDCEACNVPGSEGICALVADGNACGEDGACCGGACCGDGQECIDGVCQVPVCRPPASFCATADQCCQDEPTFCEDVPRCGAPDEGRCCRPVGSTCIGFSCECCGFSDCIDGVCVATCSGFGFECFDDGHCCDDLVCGDNICQEASSTCLAPLEECTAADQCCQDQPTGCADVVGCGGSRLQCCGLPGSSCQGSCDCCGADRCVDGACVATCLELGEDCTLDVHCCTGICDEVGRCFDPDLGLSCDNPIADGSCEIPGSCQGCEIEGVCHESCGETPITCVTTTEGANRCVLALAVAGRGCLQSSDCGVGRSCFENCEGDRACFDGATDICLATPTCLAPQEACVSADQCCQDEPTNCEDVPANELQGPQCCRPRGGACANRFLDCCGSDECIGGVCVEGCFGFGISCFVDDHCCDDLVCRDDRCVDPL